MIACPNCNAPTSPGRCAHCGLDARRGALSGFRAVTLLGLGLIATSCAQAEYGVIMTLDDADGDGYSTLDDCNDADDTVFPGAQEIAGDGVDSDCDGEDDPASS